MLLRGPHCRRRHRLVFRLSGAAPFFLPDLYDFALIMNQPAFQVGSTYAMRWITNADAITLCKCTKRTAKFVSFEVDGFGPARCAIRLDVFGGGEYALPLGMYSMAPCVRAERILEVA